MHEILEHAADVGFRVQADSLPRLFVQAAEAVVVIALETGCVEGIHWLSEVLYLLDGKNLAFSAKDVDEVIEVVHRAGLACKVARLRPLAVIKITRRFP
jgi:SHS2 domain-containing protein